MKVVGSEKIQTKLFKDLACGDCFRYMGRNKILMKIVQSQKYSNLNSVFLDDGSISLTSDNCCVVLVNGSFVEEKK